jgi:hypothetical protein
MNLCDSICEWCSEIELALVGVGVEIGADEAGVGSRSQRLLLFCFRKNLLVPVDITNRD